MIAIPIKPIKAVLSSVTAPLSVVIVVNADLACCEKNCNALRGPPKASTACGPC